MNRADLFGEDPRQVGAPIENATKLLVLAKQIDGEQLGAFAAVRLHEPSRVKAHPRWPTLDLQDEVVAAKENPKVPHRRLATWRCKREPVACHDREQLRPVR